MSTARTPELTATERAQLDAFEAAAYAEEALRERMTAAIAATFAKSLANGYVSRSECEAAADAALAVVRTPVDAEP